MPLFIGAAILGSGAIGAGASIFGSMNQVSSEQSAIAAMEAMYQQGLKTQQGYVNQAQTTLNPFIQGGQGSQDWYNYLTGSGGLPAYNAATPGSGKGKNAIAGTPAGWTTGATGFNPLTAPLTAPFTAANLPTTPGYQFTLDQGLKGTQNSFAAQGLGSSGAALKGAASFATGQASGTYNQQFANYLTQNQQIGNMLLGGGQVGATAGETMASIYGGAGNAALGGATQTGGNVGSAFAGIGNAYAGGAAGVSNALTGSVNSALQYNMLQQLLARNGTTAGATTAAPIWGGGAFGGGVAAPAGYGPQINPFTDYTQGGYGAY